MVGKRVLFVRNVEFRDLLTYSVSLWNDMSSSISKVVISSYYHYTQIHAVICVCVWPGSLFVCLGGEPHSVWSTTLASSFNHFQLKQQGHNMLCIHISQYQMTTVTGRVCKVTSSLSCTPQHTKFGWEKTSVCCYSSHRLHRLMKFTSCIHSTTSFHMVQESTSYHY